MQIMELKLTTQKSLNVRFGSKADMPKNAIDVAIGGKADIPVCTAHGRL